MRPGHADAQFMFEATGVALGFRVRRTWSRALPTDGVWLLPSAGLLLTEAPAVALEVAVTEGPKAIKGSLDTLAEVSPSLGILLINDLEIRRGALRAGIAPDVIEERIAAKFALATDRAQRMQQRIEIWNYGQLRHKYHLATGEGGPETLARVAG